MDGGNWKAFQYYSIDSTNPGIFSEKSQFLKKLENSACKTLKAWS